MARDWSNHSRTPRRFAPCMVRPMSSAEAAWFAGILDGEGYISADPPSLKVGMSDFDVIDRILAVTGAGYLLKDREFTWKKHLRVWKVSKLRDVVALLALAYPWLSARRRARCEEVFDYYERRMNALLAA